MRRLAFALLPVFTVLAACTGSDPVLCSGADCPADPSQPGPDGGSSATPAFDIADGSAALTAVQNTTQSVDVTITRSGFEGAVSVTVSGLPAGVSAAPLVIAAGSMKGTLSLSALSNVPQGTTPITLAAADVSGGSLHREKTGSLLVRGAAGGLDTTFGNAGVVSAKVGVSGFAVRGLVVQPDGRAVIAGQSENDVVVARLDPQGALDGAYGAEGKVTADLQVNGTSGPDTAEDVALAPGGGVFVAGWTTNPYSKYALARVSDKGALDTTFGAKGYLVSDFLPQPTWNGDVLALAVAVQKDGKPVFGGEVLEMGGYHHPVIARFKTNGAPDDSFGGGQVGWFSRQVYVGATPDDSSDDTVAALALGPNDSIIGAGTSRQGASQTFFVVRLDDTGALDATFGNGGFAQVAFGTPATAKSVQVLSDGRVLVTGTTDSKVVVTRLAANGQLDSAYGGTGKAILDLGTPVASGTVHAVLDSAGRVVVAAATGANNDIVVARVTAEGTLDTTFGQQGHLVANIPSKGVADNVRIGLASDGRIIVATSTDSKTPTLFAARLWF